MPAIIRDAVKSAWIPFNTAGLSWTGNPLAPIGDWNGTPNRSFDGRSSPNEGIKIPSYMYEDILGLVTTGMGNLIESPPGTLMPSAAALPWKFADGRLATHAEVQAEFANVKKNWKDMNLAPLGGFNSKGRQLAALFLDADAVGTLISGKLQAFADDLIKQFPAFNTWPADVQLAILSMCWAQGSNFRKWPKLTAALKALLPDFKAAAAQSHVNTYQNGILVPNPGLVPRNVANYRAFMNGAGVLANNLAPETLYYPNDVSSGVGTVPSVALPVNQAAGGGALNVPSMPRIPSTGTVNEQQIVNEHEIPGEKVIDTGIEFPDTQSQFRKAVTATYGESRKMMFAPWKVAAGAAVGATLLTAILLSNRK